MGTVSLFVFYHSWSSLPEAFISWVLNTKLLCERSSDMLLRNYSPKFVVRVQLIKYVQGRCWRVHFNGLAFEDEYQNRHSLCLLFKSCLKVKFWRCLIICQTATKNYWSQQRKTDLSELYSLSATRNSTNKTTVTQWKLCFFSPLTQDNWSRLDNTEFFE